LSVAGEASPATPFGDRLAAAVARRQSQVVLGLDPDPARLWRGALDAASEARAQLAAALAEADHAARAVARAAAQAGGAESDGGAGRDGRPYRPAGGAGASGLPAAGAGRARRAGASGLPAAEGAARVPRLEAAAAVLAHCLAVVDAAGPACVAVKPQLACFERLGWCGWLALEAVCAHARERGLLVLADAKRGDVPVTAAAYAQALVGATPSPFGTVRGLGADAVTVNPLLGGDALAPLLGAARAAGAGVFALVRTSNPGAAEVFDLELADGRPLWERLAAAVHDAGVPGPRSGLSDLGAVCGATAPAHLARMRELMPRTPFLLPGIGAQGGDVASLGPAVAPGRAGALVTASRSIVQAHATAGGDPAEAARAVAERLREAAWALA
jgi:orotidine-5'-phosphate decarboxylase